MLKDEFLDACYEISQELLKINEPTKNQTKIEIKRICNKYSLERIPKNYEILSTVKGKEFELLQKVLLKKPVKTASGVAVIALMAKPFACPHGRCTYCPGGIEFNSPNSYTTKAPIVMTAIENQYEVKGQIVEKLEKLKRFGHDVSKLELVIAGGTFPFMPLDYQENFIKACYDTLNGFESTDLEVAKRENEHAKIRNVGFTIETKPDFCKKEHVNQMLNYGTTRIEIGVQSLQERVYNITNRGHNFQDVIDAFQISKDAGYKIVAHMMPGLPTMTPSQDIKDFKRLFDDEKLRPDMLKIYPALVLKNTPLHDDFINGKFLPYSEKDMIKVLTEIKKNIPRWVRIMRVQREMTKEEISAGPNMGNLRQLVHKNLQKEGLRCKCIRCREIGLTSKNSTDKDVVLKRENYISSNGKEVFLSFENSDDLIFGFLRLRFPSNNAHRKEIDSKTSIIRELHVYGKLLKLGEHEEKEAQHHGLGKRLVEEAEKIAREENDSKKMLIISAVGTREYYKKIGYHLYGPYMAKNLD